MNVYEELRHLARKQRETAIREARDAYTRRLKEIGILGKIKGDAAQIFLIGLRPLFSLIRDLTPA
jgi:hypothetical protein